jgi:hypothetical protein
LDSRKQTAMKITTIHKWVEKAIKKDIFGLHSSIKVDNKLKKSM